MAGAPRERARLYLFPACATPRRDIEPVPACKQPSALQLVACETSRARALHDVECLVDRNLPTALQDWAAFGLLDRRIERVRTDNRVAACHRSDRTIADRTIA